MLENVLISDESLSKYSDNTDLASRTKALFKHQVENWEMASNGYKQLNSVETKEFEFKNFVIRVQFNPRRIVSSSAKVDKKSIEARKCFLCYKNLPPEQKGIPYFRDYIILVNPFPIFPEHFTVPKIDHVPQYIESNLQGMLKLSKDIGKNYVVFYNGPKCGASAPDHMHYQAGLKGFMPLDDELKNLTLLKPELLFEDRNSTVFSVKNYLRKFFYIESDDIKKVTTLFKKLYSVLELAPSFEIEPMMNLISYFDDQKWKLIIFPRLKHRPDYYFREGDNSLLLSPASVDFGGVFITPREEDFNKISREIIEDIFRQVSITNEYYEFYKTKFTNFLKED
jgi:ATP adenylyltransferase/5',5'''-P-1,P-4-tetraphosphate phosphorylase II